MRGFVRRALPGLVVMALWPASAHAAGWSLQHAANATRPVGAGGSVSCTTGGTCMAVGSYLDADNLTAPAAEQRTGGTWALVPVPSAPGAAESWLNDIACTAPDDCFAVGGAGNTSTGAEDALVEHWDGASWSVQSTPSIGRELLAVACGSPTACVAVTGDHSLVWDGTSWTARSVAVPADKDDLPVRLDGASCTSATSCTAVGYYEAGSNGLAGVAERWDGTQWSLLPAPPRPDGSRAVELSDVSCTAGDACTAVGEYFPANGNSLTLALRWDGASWAIQSTPNLPDDPYDNRLTSVSCSTASACTAVGHGLTATWDGTSWTQQPTPGASLGSVSCVAPADCTGVGGGAAHWDGTSWTIESTPTLQSAIESGLDAVSCTSATACTATGGSNFGPDEQPLAERWNGTAWATDPMADVGPAEMTGVSCVSPSACLAVGYFEGDTRTNDPQSRRAVAERWDGTRWSALPVPAPGAGQGTALYTVSCRSAIWCMAVGEHSSTLDTSAALVEHWDGKRWSVVSAPAPTGGAGSSLYGVSCSSISACTAVGTVAVTDDAPLIERWDGTRWTIQAAAVPSGTASALTSVSCATASACSAVGWSASNGASQAVAEHWNGTTWTSDPTPARAGSQGAVLNGVSCAAASACTAVGYDATDAGVITRAMRWNGSRWAIQATPDPAFAFTTDLSGVSCPTRTSCTAVGGGVNSADRALAVAESWTG